MEKKFELKKYIINQSVQLITIIILEIFFYFQTSDIILITLGLELLLGCSSVYLLWRIIVFPLDVLHGYVKQEVCFSKMCNIDEYAVYGTFKRRYFCEWNFYYSSKGKLTLLVPVCKRYEEIIKMNKPKTDQKVRVYYYKHSKILYSWEEL